MRRAPPLPSLAPPRFHHFANGAWVNDPVGLHRQGDTWVLHDQRSSGRDDHAIGWGRATSDDLLTWLDEGMVIPPGQDGWIYSGCVVTETALPTAFFTLHCPSSQLQSQASACWVGSWKRIDGEAVAGRQDTRDPFVFRWGSEWRMLLAQPSSWNDPLARPSHLALFASPDLSHWTELGSVGPSSELGEMFETPFLRQIPVAGEDTGAWPWLLGVGVIDRRAGANCSTRAWFGRFDGRRFVASGSAFQLDHGPDFYAPAIWAGTEPGEVMMTGWTNSWAYARRLPDNGWSGGAHALPRRLSAIRTAEGWSLRQAPAALPSTQPPCHLHPGTHCIGAYGVLTFNGTGQARLGDLRLHISDDTIALERDCGEPSLDAIGYAGRWSSQRSQAPLHWLIDGCVTELFSAEGTTWLSALSMAPTERSVRLSGGLTATFAKIAV